MEQFKIFVFGADGKAVEYASLRDRFGYLAAVERHFNAKLAAGKSLDEDDVILQTILDKSHVIRADELKRVMQALRHFDEIGLSNDIYDILEEIKDDGSYAAVSLNGNY